MANLVQFLTQQRDAAKNQKTAAAQNVSDAKTTVEGKRTDLVNAVATLNSKQQEIASIKRKLADISTTDDGAALLAQLKAATLAAHNAQAAVVQKTAEADEAAAVLAERGAGLENVTGRLADLESRLTEAAALEKTRNQLKAAATQTVRQAAGDALNNPPFTTAKNRIETDFPEKLRERARASVEVELNRIAIAKAVRTRARAAFTNKLDAAKKARLSVDSADAALADYVKTASALLQSALASLTKIADANQEPLSQAEKDAIGSDLAARGDAADKEILLSQRQAALDSAQDVVDSTTTPTQAQIDARDQAKQQRDAAQQDVTQQVKDKLHEWEAAVPEANWHLFAEFENARRTLEWLRDTDPNSIVTAVNNSEDSLVTAVQTADTASAALGDARAAVVKRDFLFQASERTTGVRALSALRGDS